MKFYFSYLSNTQNTLFQIMVIIVKLTKKQTKVT